jgi:hypothetical protein
MPTQRRRRHRAYLRHHVLSRVHQICILSHEESKPYFRTRALLARLCFVPWSQKNHIKWIKYSNFSGRSGLLCSPYTRSYKFSARNSVPLCARMLIPSTEKLTIWNIKAINESTYLFLCSPISGRGSLFFQKIPMFRPLSICEMYPWQDGTYINHCVFKVNL